MTTTPTAKITLADTKPAAIATDALIVALAPARGRKVEVISPGLTPALRARLSEAFTAIGASAKSGDVSRLPGGSQVKATTIVGLGPRRRDRSATTPSPSVARWAPPMRSLVGTRRVALALPLDDDEALLTVSIAALLGAYDFVAFRGKSAVGRPASVRSVTVLLDVRADPEQKRAVKDVASVAACVNLARDLVNTPPSALTPAMLAAAAIGAAHDLPVEVTVWDEDDLFRDGCGGILAVGPGLDRTRRGSCAWTTPPRARPATSRSSARASPSTRAASRSSRRPAWRT